MSDTAWLRSVIVCPRDRTPFIFGPDRITCADGHEYALIEGVPILLVDEVGQTHPCAEASLEVARLWLRGDPDARDPEGLYLQTIGITGEEKAGVRSSWLTRQSPVDSVVAYAIAATGGLAYKGLRGRLLKYPLPDLPLPDSSGELLLDVGCGWGRWSLAAAKKGYRPVGIDPSLGLVLAARRVARELGLSAAFVVGDARFLPFRDHMYGAVLSYSVLQHFSKREVAISLAEIGRVLRSGGTAMVQMPNCRGLVSLLHLARRGFTAGKGFDVRYWRAAELVETFSRQIGPSHLTIEGFLGLGTGSTDANLIEGWRRTIVLISHRLRSASERRSLRWLARFADSWWVASRKR
jgi:SAM-dependent methyltransferase/uncharacterized protein YbaR (Trm112 family)